MGLEGELVVFVLLVEVVELLVEVVELLVEVVELLEELEKLEEDELLEEVVGRRRQVSGPVDLPPPRAAAISSVSVPERLAT